MADYVVNVPVVIDNGSGVMKAGFAGEDAPKAVFPSIVGRPKHARVMAGAVPGDVFIGNDADKYRGLLKINYPMEHGIVQDWNDMERVWQHVYSEELKVHSEEHPVLLTEAPLNPRRNRERAAEVFFETFNVPALFVSMQAVLSLYSSGRTTGVVLDSGDGVTHCVPIYEGFALPHSFTRADVAGRDVTRQLQLLLRRGGYAFRTSAELEVVRAIKERMCYVALNPAKAEKEAAEQERAASGGGGAAAAAAADAGGGDGGGAAGDANPADVGGGSYTLPDGNVIRVGAARFRAPEVLFNPELVGEECRGVHQLLVDSITRSDLDLRKELYANVVLSGGSTLYRGFGDRLLSEVKRLAPKDVKIRISAPQERKYSTWIGGSILASLNTFRKMWVSASEYAEEGAAVLHRKTF